MSIKGNAPIANTANAAQAAVKPAAAGWASPAHVTTSKVVAAFESALANVESVSREVWGGTSKGLSAADAGLLLGRAKAAIIDIDSAAQRAAGSGLPEFANKAISDIYSSVSRLMPAGNKTWVAPVPAQERKNLAAFQSLGALVSKLTKP